MSQFQCPTCHVISDVAIQVDEEQRKINVEVDEAYKKSREEKDRKEKEVADKYREEKERLLPEYVTYDDRSLFDKLIGIRPYNQRFKFNHFLWDKHNDVWEMKYYYLPFSDELSTSLHSVKPASFIACPVCGWKHRFDKKED